MHFPARAGGGAGHPGAGVRGSPGPGRVGATPGRKGGVRAPPSAHPAASTRALYAGSGIAPRITSEVRLAASSRVSAER
jgi:hypothetical protein